MSVNDKARSKPLAAGRRRHNPVIDLRETDDINKLRGQIVREQHERRKLLTKGEYSQLPPAPIDTKKVMRQIDDPYFKTERVVTQNRRRSRDDNNNR